jgi:hypothetical protein
VVAGGFFQYHRDTTAPLLDQAEFTEHATDDAITQTADPAREVVEAQAGDQDTWVFNFDSVVEVGFALRGL